MVCRRSTERHIEVTAGLCESSYTSTVVSEQWDQALSRLKSFVEG